MILIFSGDNFTAGSCIVYNFGLSVPAFSTTYSQYSSLSRCAIIHSFGVRNISPVGAPFYLSKATIESGVFAYKGGGFNYYNANINSLSFADIARRINGGNHDNTTFTTIQDDGTVIQDNFIVELFAADKMVVPRYLTYKDASERPSRSSRNTPGHTIALRNRAVIKPIFRHSGEFTPKFIDIINF